MFLPVLAVGWRPQVGAGEHRPCGCRRFNGYLRPHTGQAPAGADREDRGKLLFPKYVPGSTPTPAKRKAGGNKNLRQGDSSSHPADGRRRTQRVDESLVRLTFLPFMQRKAGSAHLAQKDLIFGKCATGVQKVCSRFPA